MPESLAEVTARIYARGAHSADEIMAASKTAVDSAIVRAAAAAAYGSIKDRNTMVLKAAVAERDRILAEKVV